MNMSLKSEERSNNDWVLQELKTISDVTKWMEKKPRRLEMTEAEIAAAQIAHLDIKIETPPDRIFLIANYLLRAGLQAPVGWYLINVKQGAEDEIIQNLKILGNEVWRPQATYRVRIQKTRKFKTVAEDAVPGYLFVKIDERRSEAPAVFTSIKGVKAVVSSSRGPLFIPTALQKRWMNDIDDANLRRKPDLPENWTQVTVKTGLLKGFIAQVVDFCERRNVFNVTFDLDGHVKKYEISLENVKKDV